ncbi:MAG: hypothetical protein JNM43_07580 [Planctomycetaceae bacterium]|nr:hypothetical protein [Planctomycetaceae bacterium]
MIQIRFFIESLQVWADGKNVIRAGLKQTKLALLQLLKPRPITDLGDAQCHPLVKKFDEAFWRKEHEIEQQNESLLVKLDEHSRMKLEEAQKSIETVEKKSDWILGLQAGLCGSAIFYRSAAMETGLSSGFWVLGFILSVPGLLLAIRCRLPGAASSALTTEALLESITGYQKYNREEFQGWPRISPVDKRHTLYLIKSRAVAAYSLKITNDWKASCVAASSVWLIVSFLAFIFGMVCQFFGF